MVNESKNVLKIIANYTSVRVNRHCVISHKKWPFIRLIQCNFHNLFLQVKCNVILRPRSPREISILSLRRHLSVALFGPAFHDSLSLSDINYWFRKYLQVKRKEFDVYLTTISSAEIVQQDRMGSKHNIKNEIILVMSPTLYLTDLRLSSKQSWWSDMKRRWRTVKFN